MPKEERIYYSDSNNVRIGAMTAVFGQYRYATRNIEALSLAEESVIRWPAYAVMLVGVVALVYGTLTGNTTWLLIGVAGIGSGLLNFARKKRTYALRIVTPKGPVLVLAAKDRAYVQRVLAGLERAVNDAQRPAPAELQ